MAAQLLRKEPGVEVWDDDDFEGIDNLNFRNASSTTVGSARPRARESTGSRLSIRSGDEEEGDWQLLLANDDETSTKNAIENAKKRGIPLPMNVPPSALLGGTIKRLGGRKVKKAIQDDWDEDLELPVLGGLRLKMTDGKDFPETLRHVSGTESNASSPSKGKTTMSFMERLQAAGSANVLDKFKDDMDDFFDDVPTIKVAKARNPFKIPNFTPPGQTHAGLKELDTFEDDFELPTNGQLKLSSQSQTPKTPASQVFDDFDQDWAEGSLGSLGSVNTSFSNVRRMVKSARSSSISARSPSVFSPTLSSCRTVESEDEGLEGLVLPLGPLNLGDALKKRKENVSPEPTERIKIDNQSLVRDDFLEGLEFGPGPIFDTGKLTLNRNIKQRPIRQMSPPKRPATTLTFTSKASSASTRIPKPASGTERPRSKLEPVSESGGPISHYRTSNASRIGSHSQQNSLTSLPIPVTIANPSIPPPSTPSRRLAARTSREMLRPDSAQNNFLKNKRSLPAMNSANRVPASPARTQPSFQRPTSRQDRPLRTTLTTRPRTPVDRSESSLAAARRPSSFASSGITSSQPRLLSKQGSRTFHRPTSSDTANENITQPLRPNSRLSDRFRSNTPNTRRDLANKSLARVAATKRVTEPVRRRGFGDGTELDGFDDLPTSNTGEAKFIKQPTATLKAGTTRRPLSGILQTSSFTIPRSEAPSRLAFSPTKNDNNLPSFARSTAASRLAREQRIGPSTIVQAQRHPANIENHQPPTPNWKSIINNKPLPSPRQSRRPTSSKQPPRQPQLISKIGAPMIKGGHGMEWNEQLLSWDGNEAALAPFDIPSTPKQSVRGPRNPSPVTKPALIANFTTTKGVQVVGGMVFDPDQMMWVKMSRLVKNNAATATLLRNRSDSLTNTATTTTSEMALFDHDQPNTSISEADDNDDEDEDPFAGIADLKDESTLPTSRNPAAAVASSCSFASSDDDTAAAAAGHSHNHHYQAEEFDVGPSFVKRQLAEEEKWRRRLKGWEFVLGRADTVVPLRGELRALVMMGGRGRMG